MRKAVVQQHHGAGEADGLGATAAAGMVPQRHRPITALQHEHREVRQLAGLAARHAVHKRRRGGGAAAHERGDAAVVPRHKAAEGNEQPRVRRRQVLRRRAVGE